MKRLTSIDVTSSSSDDDEDQDDSTTTDEEHMLLEAQREMEEAEAMLRQAEMEAARWDKELDKMNASATSS